MEGSGSASGSISQRHGSADPDQDPHENVMDPQHWFEGKKYTRYGNFFVPVIGPCPVPTFLKKTTVQRSKYYNCPC